MSYPWSDNIPMLGEMTPQDAIEKIRALGNEKTTAELEGLRLRSLSSKGVMGAPDHTGLLKHFWQWWDKDRPWKHTGFVIGYIDPIRSETEEAGNIRSAMEIHPDAAIKAKPLKITLDRFFVAEYPGRITHRILLKFYTRNYVHRGSEEIHFNMICNARDGESASISGSPIFIGVHPDDQGLVLGCECVEVVDRQDQEFLSFLESEAFKSGLQMISMLQPAITLVASTAYHITKMIASRKPSAKVHEFELNLHFGALPSHCKLLPGSYIVIQISEDDQASWNWNDWRYRDGRIVRRDYPGILLPYNYFIFGIDIC
jgi:hypothetical protein